MPRTSSLFSDIKYRLRAIFRRKAMEDELADELQFHCEREAAKLVNAGGGICSEGEDRAVPDGSRTNRSRLAFASLSWPG